MSALDVDENSDLTTPLREADTKPSGVDDGWGSKQVEAPELQPTDEAAPETDDVDGDSREPSDLAENARKDVAAADEVQPEPSDGWGPAESTLAEGEMTWVMEHLQREPRQREVDDRTAPSEDDEIALAQQAVDAAYAANSEFGTRDAGITDARGQVDAAYLAEDAELLPAAGDFRQKALDAFGFDPESTQRAKALGEHLASEMPPQQWEVADEQQRDQAARDFGLELAKGLDLAPIAPILDANMPPRQLGLSRGDQVYVNRSLIENPDPSEIIQTLAHEYRHQWQDQVVKGRLEHPGGADDFFKLVSGDITYASDHERDSKYVWNRSEVDAESFAQVASSAYNQARYR